VKTKWIKLAADLLEEASDEFSNHGCNDWDFPSDWTKEEQQEFVKAMNEDNGTPEEYDPEHLHVPDWWVMSFLARQIKKLKEE
jgi:hypothetical protein